jgi:hypothetical protein
MYTVGKKLASKRCSLCGQSVDVTRKSSLEEIIDGTCLTFDTSSCFAMSKRFHDVYGKRFATQLAARA